MGVKVTNIPGAYSFEGKSYGPFSATNKKGFVEVPADLAASLNLPLHESELTQAQDEIQPDGADIQELLDANHSLKEELDEAKSQLRYLNEDVLPEVKRQQDDDRAQVADLKQQLADQHIGGNSIIADHQNRVRELEADLEKTKAMLDSTHEGNRQLGAVRDALQAELAKAKTAHDADEAEWEKQRDSLLIDTADALDREKAVQAELESTQSDFIKYQNDLPGLRARVAELELGKLGEATADMESAVQNNTQALKEMTFADTTVTTFPGTPTPAEPVMTELDKASKPAPAPKKASKP